MPIEILVSFKLSQVCIYQCYRSSLPRQVVIAECSFKLDDLLHNQNE